MSYDSSVMNKYKTDAIDAEIEALRTRIQRLRLEKKVAALAEAESRLRKLAEANRVNVSERHRARKEIGSTDTDEAGS